MTLKPGYSSPALNRARTAWLQRGDAQKLYSQRAIMPTATMTIPAIISLFRSNQANLAVSRPSNESQTIPTMPNRVASTQVPIAASDENTPRVLAARK